MKKKTATKQVRVYPDTLKSLQEMSEVEGKTIARIISELVLAR